MENPDVQPGGKQTSKQTGLLVKMVTQISIPWSLSINYSVRFGNTNVFNKEKMEYEMDFMHNFSLNGSISLTPHCAISGNSSYDFKAKQFTYTSISVERDLHCWNMS